MECQYCIKNINNIGSLRAHEKGCNLNPNKVKQIISKDAGRKKGCISVNKGKILGRVKGWDIKYSLEKVLVENSTYPRHSLKKRIIYNNLITYNCHICGMEPLWLGKRLPLILDHIDGINNNNKLENLRFVCSNCDSQLDTYKSKNRKNPVDRGTPS